MKQRDTNLAVCYTRVSTTKETQHTSLLRQKEELEKFAVSHQLQIVRYFEDTHSGYESDRPGMLELLDFIRKKDIQHVLVQDDTRLGRGHAKTAILHLLMKSSVTVHTLQDQGIMKLNDMDTMMLDILSIVEEYQRKIHNAKIRRGVRKAINNGYNPAQNLSNQGNKKASERVEAPIETIVKMKIEGNTFEEITKRLNDMGYEVSRATVHRRYQAYKKK
ncbi:YneB family resolvase-like protein [Paenisporosarcina cavernae]|uniref:Recombinase family protein n=1 Tax=Paenisporosarcina cavernae TaxID=2320858 RepID=A0A385YRG7_9BACL|nr:recombinase family protein [Paenisporosarcina cavernae]AYC29329.1 recombinase family protein [Paenisporosarcina cavernae]